jgi:hypothetical protein
MPSVINIVTNEECEIFIQGKSHGKTPKKVVVNPGFVIVNLVHPQYGRVSKQVEIINGDTQNLYHNFP